MNYKCRVKRDEAVKLIGKIKPSEFKIMFTHPEIERLTRLFTRIPAVRGITFKIFNKINKWIMKDTIIIEIKWKNNLFMR